MTNPHQEIFDRLRAATPALARTSAEERISRIERLYGAVYDLRAEIGKAGRDETGADGRGQLIPLKEEIAYASAHLAHWMRPDEVEQVPALQGRRARVHYEPKGVVLHLSTWNAPFLISLQPVVHAMAAGNAVVLKPSEIAPLAADLLVRIVERAGLTDQVAVVTGGPDTAQALLDLPFDHICYVGNNRVGRLVMEAAARHFAGITLEMGGKNPVIVDGESDLSDTAARIVAGRHIIGGQACLCPDYILVHEDCKQELTGQLLAKIEEFYDPDGKGCRESADLPNIINERHATRIKGLLDDALSKGAHAVTGGTVDVAARYVEPTVLDGVTEDMAIFSEEIFGPVLHVHGFTDRQQALREIEKRPKPLGLYIFSSDPATVDWYLDRTRAGSTAVNSCVVQATVPSLPFGGANHSGIGRLAGEAGFREFCNPRGVVADAPAAGDRVQQFYPPFPPGMGDALDALIAP